jgi:F0F1-type ATP synthase assembly protein I
MEPNEGSPVMFRLAVKVLAQMGVLLVLIIGGAAVIGWLLDRLLGTKPIFIIVLLLASIPVTIWTIYRYSIHQSRHNLSSHKEDKL